MQPSVQHFRLSGRRAVMVALIVSSAIGSLSCAAGSHTGGGDDTRMDVSLADKKLYIKRGNSIVQTYDVAVGTDNMPTPRGRFMVRKIVWNPSWVPPNSAWAAGKSTTGPGDPNNPMRVAKIYFREPDFYIHGTSAPNTVGTEASHGCLRMTPTDVYQVARYLMEHGGSGRSDAWYQHKLDSPSESETVMLSRPILIMIQ